MHYPRDPVFASSNSPTPLDEPEAQFDESDQAILFAPEVNQISGVSRASSWMGNSSLVILLKTGLHNIVTAVFFDAGTIKTAILAQHL
jgi:hypothetical protein